MPRCCAGDECWNKRNEISKNHKCILCPKDDGQNLMHGLCGHQVKSENNLLVRTYGNGNSGIPLTQLSDMGFCSDILRCADVCLKCWDEYADAPVAGTDVSSKPTSKAIDLTSSPPVKSAPNAKRRPTQGVKPVKTGKKKIVSSFRPKNKGELEIRRQNASILGYTNLPRGRPTSRRTNAPADPPPAQGGASGAY